MLDLPHTPVWSSLDKLAGLTTLDKLAGLTTLDKLAGQSN